MRRSVMVIGLEESILGENFLDDLYENTTRDYFRASSINVVGIGTLNSSFFNPKGISHREALRYLRTPQESKILDFRPSSSWRRYEDLMNHIFSWSLEVFLEFFANRLSFISMSDFQNNLFLSLKHTRVYCGSRVYVNSDEPFRFDIIKV